MKTFIDRQKVRQRAQLSHTASISGLILLMASVVLPLFLPKWVGAASMLMVIGLGTSMVGIYFANRWVRKPRPEDQLDKVLKGLSDSHHLYHYPSLPCDHVLLTPNGVVILETVNMGGDFSYKKGHWKEAMTVGRALRYIVEEHLGDPIKAASETGQYLQNQFGRLIKAEATIPILPAVIFIHPNVHLEVENAPITVCELDKLRKRIVLEAPRLEPDVYEKLSSYLEGKTI